MADTASAFPSAFDTFVELIDGVDTLQADAAEHLFKVAEAIQRTIGVAPSDLRNLGGEYYADVATLLRKMSRYYCVRVPLSDHTGDGFARVTFPQGRFTRPPQVFVMPESTNATRSRAAAGITTDGCEVWCRSQSPAHDGITNGNFDSWISVWSANDWTKLSGSYQKVSPASGIDGTSLANSGSPGARYEYRMRQSNGGDMALLNSEDAVFSFSSRPATTLQAQGYGFRLRLQIKNATKNKWVSSSTTWSASQSSLISFTPATGNWGGTTYHSATVPLSAGSSYYSTGDRLEFYFEVDRSTFSILDLVMIDSVSLVQEATAAPFARVLAIEVDW